MDILIPDSWLKSIIKTNAKPEDIAKYLSLSGPSVEKTTQEGKDTIYSIEITTNRVDSASILGVAREISAILPRFNLKASLLPIKVPKGLHFVSNVDYLNTKIDNKLCYRFAAVLIKNVNIKESPLWMKERLEKVGIRPLNNIVDISNYLMIELGQPMHTFDYDKIKGAKMILRESAGGEKITTLDDQIRPLPDGTIIIEDGEGRIIDLCGIMGGKNSEVDGKTKRVLLFVQTYDPVRIRQACQKLAFRTDAASRFEKGVDPKGVLIAMGKAIEMFEKNAEAEIASQLIDIYPHPPKEKRVKLDIDLVNKIRGI